MRFGVCFGIEYPERVEIAKNAGFDYIEGGFCTLSRGSDEVFEAFKKTLDENNMKCECANGFFPRDLCLIGDKFNREAVEEYIEKGMKRGALIGLKKIAFGSSRARSVPENMSFDEGFKALGQVLRDVIAPICDKYGVTIVTEPLRQDESNIINTITEGVMLGVLSGNDRISTLGDCYHMIGEGDTFEDVRKLKGALRHSHISNPVPRDKNFKRTFPKNENEWDYKGFIEAMSYAGVDTCSVEAQTENFEEDCLIAGKLLSQYKDI